MCCITVIHVSHGGRCCVVVFRSCVCVEKKGFSTRFIQIRLHSLFTNLVFLPWRQYQSVNNGKACTGVNQESRIGNHLIGCQVSMLHRPTDSRVTKTFGSNGIHMSGPTTWEYSDKTVRKTRQHSYSAI